MQSHQNRSKPEPPRSPSYEHKRIATAMNALAHPRRMLVFDTLAASADGLCYSDLLGRSGLSISTLNHHLRPMKAARLVTAQRRGRQVIYRLRPGAIAHQLQRVLDE